MFKVESIKKSMAAEGVIHTTLNPEGPGVLRIYLIPPKYRLFSAQPSLVLLNGVFIIPLRPSWAIMLGLFIKNISHLQGSVASAEVIGNAVDKTALDMKGIYFSVSKESFIKDLKYLLITFEKMVGEKTVNSDIKHFSLKKYAKNMSAPHRMDLMISAMTKDGRWNCPNRCLNCYAKDQPDSGREELTTAKWKAVIDILRKQNVPQLTFTGGEPLLREDLTELVEYSRQFITRLNTNGVLLTEKLCSDLRAASLDSVQITLYSSSGKTHNTLVGADTFAQTVRGIKYALAAGLDVSINTPLRKENTDYLTTLAFVKSIGVTYVTCSGIIEAGAGRDNDCVLTKTELNRILKNAFSFAAENDMEITFTSPGSTDGSGMKKNGFKQPVCGACLSNMAIAPDGTVIPCQSWLDGSGLGNILTTPWKAIWQNPRCKSIRDSACVNKCLLADKEAQE